MAGLLRGKYLDTPCSLTEARLLFELALYASEFGWDDSYEALVARIVADYVDNRDPAAGAAWIAEVDGRPTGRF